MSEIAADHPTLLSCEVLAQKIAQFSNSEQRVDTRISGLTLHRWPHPTDPTSYVMAPSICLIGQGRKRVVLGEDVFTYDASGFLITSVDLPVVSQVLDASEEEPYLGLSLELDLKIVARLMIEQPAAGAKVPNKIGGGMAVGALSAPLEDAFIRLLDLLGHPDDIPTLAPLVVHEIIYRLLMSEQGPRLRQLVSADTHSFRIARAIDWLKAHYEVTLRIDDLAHEAGLSNSAFHAHFKNMTSMSPLQFQKKLRLNEARRLMLVENFDASAAAFEVGYESPSQFNREYRRQFGAPPMRDIKNLVQEAVN